MIRLILDGNPVIPKETATIKLTVENPYFTKSSSYTYDVELPLSVPENRTVFGWLNRLDVSKSERTLDAVLYVDGEKLLIGKAHITSVTEQAVKVQVLGDSSAYNFRNKSEGIYIDELELGDWFMTTWPDGSHWVTNRDGSGGHWAYWPAEHKETGTTNAVLLRAKRDASGNTSDKILTDNLFSGDYPWVAYPVVNSSAGLNCNTYAYRIANSAKTQFNYFLKEYANQRGNAERTDQDGPVSNFAVQPFVWIMAEKIAAASGFTLAKEDNALYYDDFFRRIFIVNTGNHVQCNRVLPHWSLNEWWTQVENTFGLVLGIDYSDLSMTLRKRTEHYSADVKKIEVLDIIDEFTVDVNDETQTDISTNNVGFADYENGPEDILSEDVMAAAIINEDYDSISDLKTWAVGQGAAEMKQKKNVLFQCADGRHYIYSEKKGILEVNMFRPRMKNPAKKDVEIELKFVPARYVQDSIELLPNVERGTGDDYSKRDEPVGDIPAIMLQTPGVSDLYWYRNNDSDGLDIEAVVEEEEDAPTKEDSRPEEIYLAIADLSSFETYSDPVELTDGSTVTHAFKYPRPLLRERAEAPLNGDAKYKDSPYSLSLIPIEGQINLASESLHKDFKVSTTVRHCFKFVADRIQDVSAIFLFHNKTFVCERIEADITSAGLSKLFTGYFYEIG